jgi:glycosyltransferase involved in cell wall biosynthesis
MNKNNRALVILTPGCPKDENDTACLPFLQNFIRELNRQSPQLHIVTLAFDYPFLKGAYYWHNNEVISFNGWEKRNLKKLLKWLLVWRRMRKIRRGNNVIGILSLWCNECAFIGNRFAKRHNLPHFCWIQGQDAKRGNIYVKRIKPSATELVAISDFIQSEFEKNYSILPKHIIPPGISPDEFPVEGALKDIDFLGVGSLIPLKQYHLFVDVIYQLRQYFPGVKSVLCGKGPEENNLRMQIEKYGLQNNITLTGELPHTEILRAMNRSKVFLHTSNYEGLGVVCIEALYAGCHVLSFVKPILEDIEQWHIVRTKEELVEKARTILGNPVTQYRSVLTFTMKESVKNILQLYNYKESTTS